MQLDPIETGDVRVASALHKIRGDAGNFFGFESARDGWFDEPFAAIILEGEHLELRVPNGGRRGTDRRRSVRLK